MCLTCSVLSSHSLPVQVFSSHRARLTRYPTWAEWTVDIQPGQMPHCYPCWRSGMSSSLATGGSLTALPACIFCRMVNVHSVWQGWPDAYQVDTSEQCHVCTLQTVMTRPSLSQNLLHCDRSRTWFGSCYALRLPQLPDPTQVCMKHWMRVRTLLIGSLMYTQCSVCSLNAGPPWDAAGFPPFGPALF